MKKISKIKRLKDSIKSPWNFWFDKSDHIGAAALTYYTVTGIVPFCVFGKWFSDFFKTKASVAYAAKVLFPSLNGPINMMAQISSLREQVFSHWWGWAVFVLIVFQVIFFLNNIQKTFNRIWRSEDRKHQFLFSLLSAVILVVAIIAYAGTCLLMNSLWLDRILGFGLIYLITCFSFKYLPYDKQPGWPAVLISSAVSTATTLLLLCFLPKVSGWLFLVSGSYGVSFLLLVFWLFWTWYIIILAAKLCTILDKSDSSFLRDQTFSISPSYELFLSVLSAGYIYANPRNKDDLRGLTFKEIRNGMFLYDEEDEEGVSSLINKDILFPLSLLNRIIRNLSKRNIIKKSPEKSSMPRYEPANDIASYTVGDMLKDFLFNGSYDFEYRYEKVARPLWESISRNFIDSFATDELFRTPLKDVKTDIDIVEYQKDTSFSELMIRDINEEYNTKKYGIQENCIKANIKEALKSIPLESFEENLRLMPDSPEKEEYLSILKEMNQ